ncbi:RES domain-containing protein [Microbacterium sp. SA39]|uniref:RES domain-containing protein n=1 Tax=Microbacterium sp. SA39 TaxID=1263625 RepID=UPI00061E582E|nr:RES domain-containing protein [Microbacterium sp. SA39]KJQ55452.1 RES domain protein [Microbacterium sp. SA39]
MTAVQQPPEPARSYGSFPKKTITSGTALFRAHRADRSAWWFDSSPHGRFNLTHPRGTCCTATRAETAIREKVRDEVSSTGVVSRVFAETFALSALSAPAEYTCAAVSSSRAERFGVVRDLVTTGDYGLTQRWARAFASHGFGGVFYGSGYTTGRASTLALFGDEGAPGGGFTAAVHLRGPQACEAVGMTVTGPPRLSALTVVENATGLG